MSHEVNAAPEGAERNSVTQEEREGRGRAFRILLEGVRGWARDIVFFCLDRHRDRGLYHSACESGRYQYAAKAGGSGAHFCQ